MAGLLTLSSVAFAIWLWLQSGSSIATIAFIALPLVGSTGFALWYAIAIASKYRVTTTEDAIELVMVFRRHRILKSEIRGLRGGSEASGWGAVIWIEFNDTGRKSVDIHLATRKHAEILSWFDDIPNLDGQETLQQTEAILSDEDWGRTREQRRAALKHQKRIALALNLMGAAAAASWLLASRFLTPVIALNLLLPLVALGIAAVATDRWTYGAGKANDVRPSIGFFYLAPIALLAFLAVTLLLRFPAIGLTRWTVTIAIAAAFGYAAACMLIRNRPRASGKHLLLVLTISAYASSSVQLLNTFGGRTLLNVYEVEVTDRIDDENDSTLRLAPWGPFDQEPSIVTHRPAPVGTKVEVLLVRGLLGLQYWTVTGPAETAPSNPAP